MDWLFIFNSTVMTLIGRPSRRECLQNFCSSTNIFLSRNCLLSIGGQPVRSTDSIPVTNWFQPLEYKQNKGWTQTCTITLGLSASRRSAVFPSDPIEECHVGRSSLRFA